MVTVVPSFRDGFQTISAGGVRDLPLLLVSGFTVLAAQTFEKTGGSAKQMQSTVLWPAAAKVVTIPAA
jgi:hypothetical protein